VFMSEVYHKPGSVCRIRYAKSTIFLASHNVLSGYYQGVQ